MRIWFLQGGRVTVTKNCSVKTPRAVIVAVYYEDVVRGFSREATSEVARLRSSRAECREREHRERIYGGDFAGVVSQTHVVCGFSVQFIYRLHRALDTCKKTLTRNLTQFLSHRRITTDV